MPAGPAGDAGVQRSCGNTREVFYNSFTDASSVAQHRAVSCPCRVLSGGLRLRLLFPTDAMSRDATTRSSNRTLHDAAQWIVPLALLLPIGLVGMLLAHSRRAERRQQEIVQNAMRDYSAVVAWQFTRRSAEAMHSGITDAMRHVSDAIGGPAAGSPEPLRDPRVLLIHDSLTTKCSISMHARFAFRVDLPSGQLVVTDSTLDEPSRRALVSRVMLAAKKGTDPHRVLFDTIAGTKRAIALAVVRGLGAEPRAVYGIEVDSIVYQKMFLDAIQEPGLLPPTLVGDTLRANLIHIRVRTASGLSLYSFGTSPGSGGTATDTVRVSGQSLMAVVQLDPSLASSLLIGGLPSSPLSALLVLFALAVLLAGAALYQVLRGRELARLRTRFVANVSHELRTPLTQISMFAETLLLGRERSEAERLHFAAVIHREARRLANLVESVLRFSATEARRNRVQVERRDLAADLRETVAAFQPIAKGADVDIALDAPETLAAYVDAAAIHQVIVNLLDNAIKHGGAGKPVNVRLQRVGTEAWISVEDEGPGVPPADASRIFEAFTRLEGPARRRVPGAGIGLAVVYGIVMAHRGRVWVESAGEIGGARFVVALSAATLPSRAVNADAVAPESMLAATATTEAR
jgi:signal transduction histidine kinase